MLIVKKNTDYREYRQKSLVSEEDEKSSSSSSSDDQPTMIQGVLSSPFSDYLILSIMGEGSYGKVAKCLKTATNETVAVKMLKYCKVTDEVMNEVKVLEKLREFDPDRFNFVRYNDTFIDNEQMYIEFELLQMSLLDFQCEKPGQFLTLKEIRPILYQVAKTLVLLKNQEIVHTDLKLDNIMLVDHVTQPLKVKVIDFGLAMYVPEPILSSSIQPFAYRAPEVILGIPFTSAVDMWSLGCLAAELFLGFLLFPGRTEYNMLQGIIKTRGQIPQRLLHRAENSKYFFRRKRTKRRGFRFWWTLKMQRKCGSDTGDLRQFLDSFDDILKIRPPHHLSSEDTTAEFKDRLDFIELLEKMLDVDPEKRITPSQLLQDPFITMTYLAEDYSNSLYFKSCCEAMEVCLLDPDSNTEHITHAWHNHREHPLILEISSALSCLSIIKDPTCLPPEQLNVLANEKGTLLDEQEPTVNRDGSCRRDSKPGRKRRRSSFQASLHSHKSLESLSPPTVDADIVKANKETPTETISPTVTIRPRKRTWEAFKAAHPESRSLETTSTVRKKRKMDSQAPSEASSEVQVRRQLKRRRDTGEDQFRNGSKYIKSPERKRRKIDLNHNLHPASTTTEPSTSACTQTANTSLETTSTGRKKMKMDSQAPSEASSEVQVRRQLKRRRDTGEDQFRNGSKYIKSPERKRRKIDLNHNLHPASTTTEPSMSPSTQTANTSLETTSTGRKKMKMDSQAPSEASSDVQLRRQLKRRRDTGEDQFRNGSKYIKSPERKRRKIDLNHNLHPASTTTEPSTSASTQTANTSLETTSTGRKKREMDSQAPSEASSDVQLRRQLKRRRDTGEDQFRNGSKYIKSPERKRMKIDLNHNLHPASTTTEPSTSASTQTANTSLETTSTGRKKMKMDSQAPSEASSEVQVRRQLKRRRDTGEDQFRNGSKYIKSPERKRRKIDLNHNLHPASTTTEPSTSASTQTANTNADKPQRKRRREESS